MGSSCTTLRDLHCPRDKLSSTTYVWTWRDGSEAIGQAGYRFVRGISHEPSICLARYIRTGFSVCILRRHRVEVEESGEIRFWKWLFHKNCLTLYDRFSDAANVYFVTDPVVSGHVSGMLERSEVGPGPKREEFFQNATRYSLAALASMHALHLAHLDFKWSNVWVDASHNVFLGGFMKTKSTIPPDDPSVGTIHLTYGTLSTLAPEILSSIIERKNPDRALLPKADMWALGVALVEALTDEWVGGIRLNAKSNDVAPETVLKALIEDGGIERIRSHLLDHGLSAAAIAFIEHLLRPDPVKRPLAAQALRKLWLAEKKRSVGKDFWNMDLNPQDIPVMKSMAKDAEDTLAEPLPKIYQTIGQRIHRFGYDILKRMHEDIVNGTVVVTAECRFNGTLVVVKAVRESQCEKGERFYWQQLHHERCLQLVDSFLDSGVVFFVTDHMLLGSVEEHAKKERISEETPLRREAFYRNIIAHVLEAFQYLHQQGFTHLDFQWKHVLLDDLSGAKLSGFQHLNSLYDEERPILGYMPFRAPEAFISGSLRRSTLQKADIWSLGAALLQSVAHLNISGQHFDERQTRAYLPKLMFTNIENNIPRLPSILATRPRGGHSQEFQDIIIDIMHFLPELRPSADQLANHKWLLYSSEPKPGIDVI